MDLQARVERLERENRILKRAGAGVAMAAGLMLLVGSDNPRPKAADVMQAKTFQVVDDSGAVLSEWKAKSGQGGMFGELSFGNESSMNKNRLVFQDSQNESRISSSMISTTKKGTAEGIGLFGTTVFVSSDSGASAEMNPGLLHLLDSQGRQLFLQPTSFNPPREFTPAHLPGRKADKK